MQLRRNQRTEQCAEKNEGVSDRAVNSCLITIGPPLLTERGDWRIKFSCSEDIGEIGRAASLPELTIVLIAYGAT